MHVVKFLLLVLLTHMASIVLIAQNSATSNDVKFPLFETVDPLKLTISANFKQLLRDNGEDPSYHPAQITYTDAQGEKVSINAVRLRIRGNFRRQNCGFPPIRINFETDKVGGTIFEGQDKLKLVTHCESKKEIFQSYTLQEYLIYRMYNALTDYSFRVKLLEITYIDSSGKYDPIQKYGFLIEDEDLMAERLGGKMIEAKVNPGQYDQNEAGVMAVFQFMIGNTDWSIPNQHNVKSFSPENDRTFMAIPYDFDWSGIIAPPYAEPNPLLGTSSVKQRVFRGLCRSEESFQADFQLFKNKKEEILSVVKNFEPLATKIRMRTLEYLNDFFELLEDPKKTQREIVEKCR